MKFVYAVICVIALSGVAIGADEQPRLTTEQVINLVSGLRMFDGYKAICKKNGNDEECQAQWKVQNGVRYTIAMNLDAALRIVTAYAKAHQDMLEQYMLTGVGGAKDYAEKYHVTEDVANEQIKKFNADDRAALDKPVDVKFARITKSDIKIDENPYPPSLLSLILPILD